MHLIFGGSYQGKLDYAKDRYGFTDGDIYSCFRGEEEGLREPMIDFSKKVVYGLEEFVLDSVRCGREARVYLEANKDKWQDTVFICTDISSGVVPVEKEMREWREMTGRTLMYLGKEAKEVTRVFCGLPQNIK